MNWADWLNICILRVMDIHWSYQNLLFWAGIVWHRLSANQIVRCFKLKKPRKYMRYQGIKFWSLSKKWCSVIESPYMGMWVLISIEKKHEQFVEKINERVLKKCWNWEWLSLRKKVSIFGVFLVRIFLHSDWIRTRNTPNTNISRSV